MCLSPPSGGCFLSGTGFWFWFFFLYYSELRILTNVWQTEYGDGVICVYR